MPQRSMKSMKAIIVEGVLFVSLFALVGHLSVNFWERYVIQTELAKMKNSLYSLKDTVANIGLAYDDLHKELKTLEEDSQLGIIGDKNGVKKIRPSNRKVQTCLDAPIQTFLATKDESTYVKPTGHNKYSQIPSFLQSTLTKFTKLSNATSKTPHKKENTQNRDFIGKNDDSSCEIPNKSIEVVGINKPGILRKPRVTQNPGTLHKPEMDQKPEEQKILQSKIKNNPPRIKTGKQHFKSPSQYHQKCLDSSYF